MLTFVMLVHYGSFLQLNPNQCSKWSGCCGDHAIYMHGFIGCTSLISPFVEKAKPILSKPLLPPLGGACEKFEGYWLSRGDGKPIKDENYILTDTVKGNMRDVARVVACG